MNIIYLLVPLSFVFLVGSFWAIAFAVRSNQYVDMDAAAHSVILDDREARRQTINAQIRIKHNVPEVSFKDHVVAPGAKTSSAGVNGHV